jgi:PAS domain S-box-containing protein
LQGAVGDVTERRGTEEALAERLRFETLLSEVSSKFVNVPASEVDDQIEEALRLICEFLGLDRGTVLEILRDEEQLRVTHSWAAEGFEPIPVSTVIGVKGFPWGSDKVFRGEMISFSRLDDLPDEPMTEVVTFSGLDDLPDEAMTVKQTFLRVGAKSHLTIPLSVGGSILGVVSFATLRSERAWPDELVQRLKFIGEIFTNALARKRSEEELARYRRHLEQMVQERTHDLKNANVQLRQEVKKHQQTAKALSESEERFRSIAMATPIPLIISRKSDGAILYVNKRFTEAFGALPEEVIGRETLGLYFELSEYQAMLDALEKEGNAHMEVHITKQDGTPLWVIASIQPLIFEEEQALLIGFYDITERKKSEEKLQELYKQEHELRQQIEAEMRRRIEFTRTLAHELKTPLTPVLASSDSLLAELQDERLLSLAKNISRGASSLNSRIDELLDLARGEVGILELNPEPIDLLQLLREVAESIAPLAMSKGLSLGLALPSSLPLVRADVPRIQQVVLNLLTNAVKFTPKDGKIKLKASEENALVTVEVQDTGPGMSGDEQERVFEPYHRMSGDKGRLGGLGLGLALCKRLVELHGGQIWVKSRPSGGSTFGFSLPVDTVTQPAVHLGKPGKLWKVLIIEDDQEIVDSISLAFEKDWPEAELLSTTTGEEGVDLVETKDPAIVILDLGLPDISGFEVLRQLRFFSSIPVVVLTVREAEDDVAKALEWGADDYMTKPFRKKELLARLKAQLRKQTLPDEEMPIVCGALRFDPTTSQLKCGERDVSLTVIEGRIIQYLMKYAGQVVTHTRLAEAVWDEDYDGATVSLRSHIRRLRRKLEADPGNPKLILTKAGIGYSLAKPI